MRKKEEQGRGGGGGGGGGCKRTSAIMASNPRSTFCSASERGSTDDVMLYSVNRDLTSVLAACAVADGRAPCAISRQMSSYAASLLRLSLSSLLWDASSTRASSAAVPCEATSMLTPSFPRHSSSSLTTPAKASSSLSSPPKSLPCGVRRSSSSAASNPSSPSSPSYSSPSPVST